MGFSEFIYPGATHTRFVHSIGVFHNARELMKIIKARWNEKEFDPVRAETILLAALLHDLGHGPFSHAFENARQNILIKNKSPNKLESHEAYTAKIVLKPDGAIFNILEKHRKGLAQEISTTIGNDNPTDIYHAVVSSSFDADRLDYFERDRYMTGTSAGAIDKNWLMDNLIPKKIETSIQEDSISDKHHIEFHTLAFKLKAFQAAEDFLLARHRLFSQVYLHKTTRNLEAILNLLLTYIGMSKDDPEQFNLTKDNTLWNFLKQETLEGYLALDDLVVWESIRNICQCNDTYAQELAERLWLRKPLHAIDLNDYFTIDSEIETIVLQYKKHFTESLQNGQSFIDDQQLSVYSEIREHSEKQHKKVQISLPENNHKEISRFENTVLSSSLRKKQHISRIYFLNSDGLAEAEKVIKHYKKTKF